MKLITGKHCMPCKMLKDWMTDNNVSIPEVYADENMDLVEELGVKQTPSLVLDDNTIISGIDDIEEYLENN